MRIQFYRDRSQRDYRTVGITFDSARTPHGHQGRLRTLAVSLWWWDLEWSW